MNNSELVDILTTTADFVFLSLDHKGNITSSNPAVRKIFGLQEGEIEGCSLASILPDLEMLAMLEFEPVQARGGIDSFDDEVEMADCLYLEALAAQNDSGEQYQLTISIDGETHWLELQTCKALHKQSIIFTMIISDITRRKNNEQAIRDLNQSLERKVEERTANLQSRTEQIKRVVHSCGDELKTINDTYQSMKERHMDLLDQMDQRILDGVTGMSDIQAQKIKNNIRKELVASMNLYSEDQITDQKFMLAIISLNEIFEGSNENSNNLKPGQLSGTSQGDVDDLLDSFGI